MLYRICAGDGDSRGSSNGLAGIGSGFEMLDRIRRRRRRLHMMNDTMAAIAATMIPTTTNTPATAPPLDRNLYQTRDN